MDIVWKEESPLAPWLPKRHPLRGILEGDDRLDWRERYSFDLHPPALPSPRSISPGLLASLEKWHRELGVPEASLESLRLLGDGAQAVVTGQQAGLLGGPALTLIKAVTAVAAADALSERTGRPHVPVFWSETDDHDWEEVNRAVTLEEGHRPRTFSLDWPEELRGAPAGLLPVGGDEQVLIGDFLTASGETEFTAPLRKLLLGQLDGAGTLSRLFARQILGLLGSRGLVVFDALEKSYKPYGRELWVQVLDDPLALTVLLQEAGEKVAAAGYRPVLAKKRRRAPFFLIENGRREPVFYERESFRAGEKIFTPLELRRRLDERPADFSAGVNMRPLLQDYLLPTAAYVGGPTELAYFQQVFAGYRWAGVPLPALILRPGLTFVEPPVRKLLDRMKAHPAELRGGVDGLLGAVIRRENRLADSGRWDKLRESTLRPLSRFAEGIDTADAEAAKLLERTSGKVDFLLRELEKKTVSSLRRRSEVLRDQLERSRGRLFPLGQLQERILSPFFFLNRYGDGFVDSLAGTLPRDFTLHHFGTIIP